jgi:hypothetical protein
MANPIPKTIYWVGGTGVVLLNLGILLHFVAQLPIPVIRAATIAGFILIGTALWMLSRASK